MSGPQFFWDVEQGSEEWFALRCGVATASEFRTILRDGVESKTRRTYLLKLAGEVLTGQPAESYTNWHMERGKAYESEARDLYAEYESVTPSRVGFIKNSIAGCSPDSLIGDNGGLEVKTMLPHIYLAETDRTDFPSQFRAQCQGNIWIAGREWWDLAIYWPGLPLWVKRIYRDDAYLAKLEAAIRQFNGEVAEIVERVRSGRASLTEKLKQSLAEISA